MDSYLIVGLFEVKRFGLMELRAQYTL